MPTRLWGCLAIMAAGHLCWFIASERAKAWLESNDPTYQRPGFASNFFMGRLFNSFGPVSRYGSQRRARGESTSVVAAFWGGFALSMAGLVAFLAQLGSL
jgi:hypothetical protein